MTVFAVLHIIAVLWNWPRIDRKLLEPLRPTWASMMPLKLVCTLGIGEYHQHWDVLEILEMFCKRFCICIFCWSLGILVYWLSCKSKMKENYFHQETCLLISTYLSTEKTGDNRVSGNFFLLFLFHFISFAQNALNLIKMKYEHNEMINMTDSSDNFKYWTLKKLWPKNSFLNS